MLWLVREKMMTQRTRRTTGANFTEKEFRYLMERSLGRLAFVCSDTQAHIMPVLFEFDGAYFYLSGWNLKYSERFQDAAPNSKVTLLVDDLDSPTRWVPRGVEIHLKDGRAFVGEVVGSDPSTDIAVIHVEAENLPAAALGDSEQLKVGQL